MPDDDSERDEQPHEARAVALLDAKITDALQYVGTEFHVTAATAVGVLMFKIYDLLADSPDEDADEEE